MNKVVRIETESGVGTLDAATGLLHIETPDGGLIIRKPSRARKEVDPSERHFRNLGDELDEGELGSIGSQLFQDIQADISSIADRQKDVEQGLTLLGIRVEEQGSAVVPGQSVVRSPLLLEAVLNFAANATAELLPAAGPVKMRYFGDETEETMGLTEDLERDMNRFLTVIAPEYYPDFARMLFDDVGLAGSGFKQVFNCPVRRRPASDRIASEDFIAAPGTSHIRTAQRITVRKMIQQSQMKLLQRDGHFRDTPLGPPTENATQVGLAKSQLVGTQAVASMPAGYRHTVYECYCELDLKSAETFEKEEDDIADPDGIPRPYRVSIDRDSQKVLEIRRDWDEDGDPHERRQSFVKFPFIEAIGFYCLGLMHLLGNTTDATTAAWRLMIDAGMFASFPGFLYAKDANKGQETMSMRVAAGTGQGVQTAGKPIGDIVMGLPYKPAEPAFVELIKAFEDAARRVGMAATQPVAEGKQDAPVGTTLALLEQTTKVMAAVHRGLHAAQSEEFQLLKRCFQENPESFWRGNKKPSRTWNREGFLAALENNDIVPTADPNTPSHMHRLMRAVALVQMAQAFPEKIDSREVVEVVLKVLGWDPEALMIAPPDPNAPKEPEQLPIDPVGMAAVDAKKTGDQLRAQTEKDKIDATAVSDAADRKSKELIEGEKIAATSKSDMLEHIMQRLQFLANAAAVFGRGGGPPSAGGGTGQRPL